MRIERLVYKAARMDQSGSGFHQKSVRERASMKREQLVELARLCANQARATSSNGARVSAEGRQARQRRAPRYWREAIRHLKRNGCYVHEQVYGPSRAGFIRFFILIRNTHQRSVRRSADRVRSDRSSLR